MTGMPSVFSSLANNALPFFDSICGPVRINGLLDCFSLEMIFERSASAACIGSRSKDAGVGITAPSTRADSRTSVGKLRCTGPGLPDLAIRMAFAISETISSVLWQTHDALVNGAAISACCISWKAPLPNWFKGA